MKNFAPHQYYEFLVIFLSNIKPNERQMI